MTIKIRYLDIGVTLWFNWRHSKIDEGLHEKSQWKREKREKNRAGKEKDKREMLHKEVAQHTKVEK